MHMILDFLSGLYALVARLWTKQRPDAQFNVFLGGPGAGKGTIASRLPGKHLNVGKLIRREIEQGTAFGRKWGQRVKEGKLISDRAVMQLVAAELAKPEYEKGANLDGIPRTYNQARLLSRCLRRFGSSVQKAILLEVPREDLIERLTHRRDCPSCGRTYHLKLNPPPTEGCCQCGGQLRQRDDDREEVILERLAVFKRESGALIDYYNRLGVLVTIQSTNRKGIDDVVQEVLFALEESGPSCNCD